MGIRCSLLGHDYGESFVERDREERGNEVVVTERELRECQRCGSEHVTSENTEVRPLADSQSTPDSAEDGDTDATQAADGTSSAAFSTASEAVDHTTTDASASSNTTPADGSGADDAVILEESTADTTADEDSPGRDQWTEPADPEVDPDNPTAAASADPDDEAVEFVDADPDA
ncbi:hypothetical protein PNQ20_12210, partial [Halobacterium salinarum]|nr:hypothetical protein [Halobacterium salinarum]